MCRTGEITINTRVSRFYHHAISFLYGKKHNSRLRSKISGCMDRIDDSSLLYASDIGRGNNRIFCLIAYDCRYKLPASACLVIAARKNGVEKPDKLPVRKPIFRSIMRKSVVGRQFFYLPKFRHKVSNGILYPSDPGLRGVSLSCCASSEGVWRIWSHCSAAAF